jgi:hypothetical protein
MRFFRSSFKWQSSYVASYGLSSIVGPSLYGIILIDQLRFFTTFLLAAHRFAFSCANSAVLYSVI